MVGAGDRIVFSAGGNVIGNLAAGGETWRANIGRPGDIAVAGDRVYVVAGNVMSVFDLNGCGAATCAPLWSADLGDFATSKPSVAGGVVYVGLDSGIMAFDANGCGAATCTELVKVPIAGTPGSLVVADGRLIVIGGGAITAFGPA